MAPAPQHRTFKTQAARSRYINSNYPERKMTSVPGAYKVKGGTLGVRGLRVTFYPKGSE